MKIIITKRVEKKPVMYIVAYDLAKPNETEADYSKLIEAIETDYPVSIHLQESVWVVKSDATATQIRDNLVKHLPSNAHLFVTRISRWASWRLDSEKTEWLKAK